MTDMYNRKKERKKEKTHTHMRTHSSRLIGSPTKYMG